MKILQLTKKFPFPLMDGESIAVHYLSKALSQLGCEISLCSMNTTKHHFNVSELPEEHDHYQNINTIEVDNRVKVVPAFLNLFSGKSYHVSRFESKQYKAELKRLLQKENYDFVLLETLYLTPYVKLIRKYSKAKIVMRSHNLEYEIWERMLKNMRFSLVKLYLIYLVKKLKRYELKNLNVYDYLVSVTQRDLSNFVKLGYLGEGMVVPIGIDTKDYKEYEHYNGKQLRLSFIGSLDWMPNMEGISWFLNKVWNVNQESLSGLELHIAGRNMPGSFVEEQKDNVIIHGEVDDARQFIASCQLMIVPLFSGSGMRVKILEAMALGKVVITTSLGLEGIDAIDYEHVLIANTANDFVEKIGFCEGNREKLKTIGLAARDLIEKSYDNLNNAKIFVNKLKKLQES